MFALAPRLSRLFTVVLLLYCGAQAVAAAPVRITDVRLWSGPEGTRLVLDLTGPVTHSVFTLENPNRVVVDIANASLAMRKELPAGQGPVKSLRSGPQANHGLRLVLDVATPQTPKSFAVDPGGSAGNRLVVELPAPAPAVAPSGNQVLAAGSAATGAVAAVVAPPVKTLASNAKGRDLVIAVDAGHGGQDPGAIGRGGTREKDVTLAIARKLAAVIDAEDGMRAVLIRDGDYFITLGGRTRKARQLGADMFISVHADSVLNRDVSGSSVYVLSLRGASDEAAKWLADSENAADLKGGVSLDDKSDVLGSVLLDVTQKEALSDSVEAADSVLKALRGVVSVHRPRVQHAGFVVLKSPDIPSMLVETSFISNPTDERRLRDPDHQQKLADAIRAGVRNYWYDNPPPGTKLAALAANSNGGGTSPQTLAER
jgi:N-acetylmuramoyl-L-alanine amidase